MAKLTITRTTALGCKAHGEHQDTTTTTYELDSAAEAFIATTLAKIAETTRGIPIASASVGPAMRGLAVAFPTLAEALRSVEAEDAPGADPSAADAVDADGPYENA